MFRDFIHMLFPIICACCDQALNKHEFCICTSCRSELPSTKDHLVKNNELKKVFYGRVPIELASALLFYEKGGITQHLLHDLKYKGNQEVGEVLGNWHGQLLLDSGWKREIDYVIPVPINQQKMMERGYNQVDNYAKAIANQLNAKYINDLLLRRNSEKRKTQVFKNRVARAKVTQSDFYINQIEDYIASTHILLLDDIVTTGATIEACCNALLKIPNIKISIASMAIAK